jgi:hypothetical protein
MWWWAGLDLNQRRQSQRIYSPPPLTTRAPTRTTPFQFTSLPAHPCCLPSARALATALRGGENAGPFLMADLIKASSHERMALLAS